MDSDIKDFINRCRIKITLKHADGSEQPGGIDAGYILDQIEKSASLKDFFKELKHSVFQDK